MTDILQIPDIRKSRVTSIKNVAKNNVTITRPLSLYVAVPCFGCYMMNSFMASIIGLQAACARRGVQIFVDFVGNESLVERARNILVKRFLQSGDAYTHLLFIDADIGFNPDSVFRLLDFDKDIVSAIYPKKSIDWTKVKNKVASGDAEDIRSMGLDYNLNIKPSEDNRVVNGFVKSLDVATGFLLMKRQALIDMYEHYKEELFSVNDIQGQNVNDYIAIFACMIDPETKRFLSEDYAFCRRWQMMGRDVWADLTTPLSHSGNNVISGNIKERL